MKKLKKLQVGDKVQVLWSCGGVNKEGEIGIVSYYEKSDNTYRVEVEKRKLSEANWHNRQSLKLLSWDI